MASEIEYLYVGDYVDGLPDNVETPAVDDRTVVFNSEDGFRKTKSNANALDDEASESDLNANSVVEIWTPEGKKKLPGDAMATKSKALPKVNLYKNSTQQHAITTSGSVGDTVDLTPVYNFDFSCLVIDCVKGDKFFLRGDGGSDYRLWCFVDSSNKILSNALANQSTGSGELVLSAPADGKLIVNVAMFPVSGIMPYIKMYGSVHDELVLGEEEYGVELEFTDSAVPYNYIQTYGNIGDTLTLAYVQSNSFQSVVHECHKGDVIFLKGVGGNASRLWCFTDYSNKVVSVSAANANTTENGVTLVAPADGKFIVNAIMSPENGPALFCKTTCSNSSANNSLINGLEKVDELSKVYKEKSTSLEKGYIVTNGAIGGTVDYTVVPNNGVGHVVIDVYKGEQVRVIGRGGSSSRLWCFVDASNKILLNGRLNEKETSYITLIAPADCKLIINSYFVVDDGVSPSILVRCSISDFTTKYNSAAQNSLMFKNISRDYGNQFVGIPTNLGIGEVVDYTYVNNRAAFNTVYPCRRGDVFLFRGLGGGANRLWCFVDESDVIVSVSLADYNAGYEGVIVEAPVDGKLISTMSVNADPAIAPDPYIGIAVKSCNSQYESETFIMDKLSVLQKYEFPEDFSKFTELGDFLADMDLSGNVMAQVYDKFDELCESYPDMIMKYDAVELAKMEYPRYANGIGPDDPYYEETPAYKTFIYKISNENAAAGNTYKFKKKKLFIVAGIHGSEYVACVNALALARHLLDNISKDLFVILSLFDIWILPCANGYGIVHKTRRNANEIDVNRNFSTLNWIVTGELGDNDYSDTAPDTQFETRLIEAMYNIVQPDFYVDHHCNPTHDADQFYTETASKDIWARSYKALTNISNFLIHEFPEYFGTRYQLFRTRFYGQALPYYLAYNPGQSALWYFEKRIQTCTLEVYGQINFMAGEPDPVGTGGTDSYIVNEYTLRSQLANYLQTVL